MDQRFRRGFTAAEKTELWDRWQRGESLKAIGRAFGRPSSSIYFQLSLYGGIRPALRRRSRLALTLSEREVISRGITAHQSARSIARLLGRSPSTVSREISRNGGYDGYRKAAGESGIYRLSGVPGDASRRMARRRAGGPGAVFAKARDKAAGLFQIKAFRVPGMKHQRHFGSANVIPLREVAQIGAFIGDLDRRAQLLDEDIAAYPVLAATLTERRDNLRVTIAALKKRLISLQGRADNVSA